MHKLIPLSAALLLAVSVSPLALAQGQGKAKGQDDNHGRHEQVQDRGESRGQGQGRGRGQGQDRDRDREREARAERAQPDRGPPANRGSDRRDRQDDRVERDVERALERAADRDDPRVLRAPNTREPVLLRRRADRGLIDGCPPGLAKRNNGCLPPGQARQLERARYEHLFQPGLRDARARYEDGYLYRFDPQGSLLGYVPLLGGALIPGAEWPERYSYEPAPAYFADYFRLDQDRYDYRYADGALYGVDPQTRQIAQVVALLTGQDWAIGQPAPVGYDVYNVPYQYRDRYVDTADARYRYSDGQIYQIDPTTRLVMAVIQLLT